VSSYQSPAQEWLASNQTNLEWAPLQNAVAKPLSQVDLVQLARKSGLRQMGVRPPLSRYLSALEERSSFIWNLSLSKAYAKNQGSYLGQAWNIIRPLLDAVVYVIVFGFFFPSGQQRNVIAFITIGTFVYAFMQRMITAGVDAIPNNLQLIRSHQFPRAIIPGSACLTEALLFVPAFVVMIVICMVSGLFPGMGAVVPRVTWLLFPFALILVTMFGLGVGLLLARLGAHTPDIANIVPFFLSLGRFGSGVMFSITAMMSQETLHSWLGLIVRYQPFAVYLDLIRACFGYDPAIALTPQLWLSAILWALVTFVGGFLFFWGAEQTYGRS